MAALTAERRTPRLQNVDGPVIEYRLAQNTTIHAGSMVQLNAAGRLVPAAKVANQVTAGRAERSAKSGAADDVRVEVRSGIFRWDNLGADALTAAEIGDACWVEDDQTVRKSQNAGAFKAGRVYQVDATGVWVATGIAYLW